MKTTTKRIWWFGRFFLIAIALIAGFCAPGLAQSFSWTTIEVTFPGAATTTWPGGINAEGDIVGGYTDEEGWGHGFLLSKGRFIQFDAPGSTGTYAIGINPAGDILGGFFDDSGGVHIFLLKIDKR